MTYTKPQVTLLQHTGIGTSEFAARSCYNSFDSSENQIVSECNYQLSSGMSSEHYNESYQDQLNNIEHSDLLDNLAWTFFHHSILEHAVLTYSIKGTSRGVLQEHARHRMQSISVQSTRYTMAPILNAFVASYVTYNNSSTGVEYFISVVTSMDMLVTTDGMAKLEIRHMYEKLLQHLQHIGSEEFYKLAITKSSLPLLTANYDLASDLYTKLQAGRAKRNVGDAFKSYLVTDSWKVDMVVSMNLRALKNYLTLRDSGSAFFQIRNLAQAIKQATPKKYLDLIVKDN